MELGSLGSSACWLMLCYAVPATVDTSVIVHSPLSGRMPSVPLQLLPLTHTTHTAAWFGPREGWWGMSSGRPSCNIQCLDSPAGGSSGTVNIFVSDGCLCAGLSQGSGVNRKGEFTKPCVRGAVRIQHLTGWYWSSSVVITHECARLAHLALHAGGSCGHGSACQDHQDGYGCCELCHAVDG
jgi:hypothetical protein